MNIKLVRSICLLAICCLLVSGCKKKSEPPKAPGSTVPETKTMTEAIEAQKSAVEKTVEETAEEVKATAQAMKPEDMEAAQLREMALKYQSDITAKKDQLVQLNEQLSGIPLTEIAGEKAKNLKTQIDSLTKDIKALTDQFNIYYNLLKEKKGDLSGLGL